MKKKPVVTFHAAFELLVWLLYVSLYKYSYHLDHARLPHVPNNNFPYLEICLYSISSTLFLIPYYRWAVPVLLQHKRYLILLLVTIVWFVLIAPLNNMAFAWLFEKATHKSVVHQFFINAVEGYDLNLLLTDFIAFFCIALARFSYINEIRRHQTETDNLQLQLNMLKTQLQPHFLFNTLNSLYGLSLIGSKETPRFILLLSQMMQYILYDCDREEVELQQEIDFLKGYFELEQRKFPEADIIFEAPAMVPSIKIPPLLFLPLVENSFKHGKHKLEDRAGVNAQLLVSDKKLVFHIENDMLEQTSIVEFNRHGGIGLVNIKKRLQLYYPSKHQLSINVESNRYIATLTISF